MSKEYQVIEFKDPYKDINETLYWLVEQAKSGIDYCRDEFPKFSNPIEMYNYLKPMTRFKNDPKGVELIQHPFTLFEDNYHGYLMSGAGDCDCFSVLLLSCIWANGWNDARIVLAGRSKKYPSHIYIVITWKGRDIVLDLTEDHANQERIYPYVQEIETF